MKLCYIIIILLLIVSASYYGIKVLKHIRGNDRYTSACALLETYYLVMVNECFKRKDQLVRLTCLSVMFVGHVNPPREK
jgi:hypothetical protein